MHFLLVAVIVLASSVVGLAYGLMEGNEIFQLKVSANEIVIFFPLLSSLQTFPRFCPRMFALMDF